MPSPSGISPRATLSDPVSPRQVLDDSRLISASYRLGRFVRHKTIDHIRLRLGTDKEASRFDNKSPLLLEDRG